MMRSLSHGTARGLSSRGAGAFAACLLVATALGCAARPPQAARPPRSPIAKAVEAAAVANSEAILRPASPDQPLSERDEREVEIAVLLSEQGKNREAVEMLLGLHRRNPNHAGVLEDLVWSCIPLADCRDELPALQRALAAHVDKFPGDLTRRLTLVDLAETTDSDRQRSEYVFALIRDYPDVADAWVLAAELALSAEDLQTTARLVARASECDFHDESNRERLDSVARDLAVAVRDREQERKDQVIEDYRERQRRKRSLSRRAFHIRLDDGDDF